MRKSLRLWPPSPATVIATIALIVAVSGAANAAPTVIVRKGDIRPAAVDNKALAKGAVSKNKLRNEAVTAPKIGKGAVTSEKLAPGSVTAQAIGQGSIQAGMLGPETVVTAALTDLDQVEHNAVWTASTEGVATCPPGAYVVGGGLAFPNATNGLTSISKLIPVINGTTRGMIGQFSSDAGGAASATVYAICLQ